MDLLHKRYASPYIYLDNLIDSNMFCKFVEEIIITTQREDDETKLWEFFLHKVHDKSFVEWKNELEIGGTDAKMKQSDIEATIKKSENILNSFSFKEE